MFILMSELTIFLALLWVIWNHFYEQQEINNMSKIDMVRVINSAVWADYKSLKIDTAVNTENKNMYEEYTIEFWSWELTEDACAKLLAE